MAQIETMYPMIDPFPWSSTYNSPQMATVNVADDMAALSSLYPAANYAKTTGTLKGRIVAKDGASELTGINVIARRVDQGNRMDAMSRISGDLTQGLLGPDGSFTMTGLVPGASYVVYIDQLADGGFSTPKAILLGPEEYWNANESGDATRDDACVATPIVVQAGEVREIQIAVNGIARAPQFTHIPYVLVSSVSDNGNKVVGTYGNFESPFWIWNKKSGATPIGGSGFIAARLRRWPSRRRLGRRQRRHAVRSRCCRSARRCGRSKAAGRRSRTSSRVAADRAAMSTTFPATVIPRSVSSSQTARMPMRSSGPRKAAPSSCPRRARGSNAMIGAGGTYSCEGSSRANAVSGNGHVVGGWEEIPEAGGFRVGSIWVGDKQTLLRDPSGDNIFGGWIGEVMGVNSAGTIAVGINSGPQIKDAYKWTPAKGVTSLGRYPGQVCYTNWDTGENVCEDRETVAYSVSDDGKVVTGSSRLLSVGIDDAAIYTPKMGWVLLSDFLQGQGVLEASRWQFLGATISADGTTLVGNRVAARGRLLPRLPDRSRPGVRLPRQGQESEDDEGPFPRRDG